MKGALKKGDYIRYNDSQFHLIIEITQDSPLENDNVMGTVVESNMNQGIHKIGNNDSWFKPVFVKHKHVDPIDHMLLELQKLEERYFDTRKAVRAFRKKKL